MDLNYLQPDIDRLIRSNLDEYGEKAAELRWISPQQARQAEAERGRRLAALQDGLLLDFKQTKPHLGPLSAGCRICGQGDWSCLFINGKCRCRCFYCPTTQNEISVPTTNRIPFSKAADYADYINMFGFKGVSISGGEPLLTFDRTLRFLHTVRRKCKDDLHIWMYTSGAPLTRDHLARLKDAGLNEIRFDISAVGYDLKKVAMAADLISCVTVEIPAIPEDLDRLAAMLKTLQDSGVSHLNLHQLRLTPHNCDNLKNRNYTFLHGEKVTVLESELMALDLMQKAAETGSMLAINYCSFAYKQRYQRAAARRRSANFIRKDYESITENGFIRTLFLTGPAAELERRADDLRQNAIDPRLWNLSGGKDRLYFHEQVRPHLDPTGCRLHVSYHLAALSPAISYRCAFRELRINPNRKLYIEKQPLIADLCLSDDQLRFFHERIFHQSSSLPGPFDEAMASMEYIRPGLQDYY